MVLTTSRQESGQVWMHDTKADLLAAAKECFTDSFALEMGRLCHRGPRCSAKLPAGQVVYAGQGFLVIKVDQQPQVGQDVFDV